jgi:hypothetical protein
MYIRTNEGATQGGLQYSLGDAVGPARSASNRFKRVAALITDGLKLAVDASPHLATHAQQELLRFITLQLNSRGAQEIFKRMTTDVDSLAAVLRAHLIS